MEYRGRLVKRYWKNVDIKYRVGYKEIFFKDRKNPRKKALGFHEYYEINLNRLM